MSGANRQQLQLASFDEALRKAPIKRLGTTMARSISRQDATAWRAANAPRIGQNQLSPEPEISRSDRPIDDPLHVHALLETAGIGSWRYSEEKLTCDAAASHILGGRDTSLSQTASYLLSFVHPTDRRGVAIRFELCSEAGVPFTHSCRIIRPDGETRWVRIAAKRVSSSAGPAIAIGTIEDITERKRVEDALHDSQARLSTVFNQTMVGVLHRDCALGLLMVNKRFCEIVGRTEAELDGLPMAEFTHPDDMAWNEPLVRRHEQTGQPFTAEKRYIRPDGSEVWCEINVSFVPTGPDWDSTIVVAHDISARKAAEQERQRAEDELRESDARLRLIQEAALIGTFETDPSGQTVGSRQFFRNLGLPEDTNFIDAAARLALIHPDDLERVRQEITSAIDGGETGIDSEYRIVRPGTGEVRWVFARTRFERNGEGQLTRLLGAHLDITSAKIAAEALRQSETFSRGVIEASADCIMLLDLDGTLRFMNEGGLSALEVDDPDRIYGRNWADLWPMEARSKARTAIDQARAGSVGRFNGGCPTATGKHKWWDVVVTPLTDDSGAAVRLLSIARDATEHRDNAVRVRWAANHDALTGLPNRSHFQEALEQELEKASAHGREVGLLLLDIDNFKQVNDALGHHGGDDLLRTIAQRLKKVLGKNEIAARLGGDEFAILVPTLRPERNVLDVAEAILASTKEPFIHGSCVLDCRVSIGAAIYPGDGVDADTLLKNADTALYAAKTEGRSRALLFRPSMRSEMERRTVMIASARHALANNDVLPFYQPKVDLLTGKAAGFEALLRWRDPTGAIRSPASIEAAFEDLDVAQALSERMQELVIADMRGWLDRGVDFGHVAINAAAAEFRRNDFAERLIERLFDAGISAHHLELEVTETVFLGRGADHVSRALKLLSEHGIRIALDDFGTGYASLSHLKKFPVDVIKIDRSFVHELGQDQGDTAIVLALLNLAKNLEIQVVAEGIEEEAQADFLRAHSCDLGQGYRFGPAVDAVHVPGLILGVLP